MRHKDTCYWWRGAVCKCGATVAITGDVHEHEHYNIGDNSWYKCGCDLTKTPPHTRKDSSPRTPDAPLEPGDVSLVSLDLEVDAVQEFQLLLSAQLKRVEARLEKVEQLLIHEQPPSSSRKHECHRGLTYREEQLLAKMCQSLEVQAIRQGERPRTEGVEVSPDMPSRVYKSTQ